GPAVSSGMLKGVTDRLWSVRDVFRKRLFRTRIALPGVWGSYYQRSITTVGLGLNLRHTLTYAY
ncbi:MAG TPA: hypothetical protein P5571_14905, partial [Candidatus Krumholzibacteria bacterium]|nr:hypothetical protein [Candidatus Krumholzibacteria bacterium]